MFSSFPNVVALLAVLVMATTSSSFARELRVCADPDNLPFSNSRQQGFENRIAEVVAGDLHAQLSYVWQRMGRGFVREYLNKGVCDLLIGVPQAFSPVLATAPYYRSTYVFVTRRDRQLKPASLDDPSLRQMKSAFRCWRRITRQQRRHWHVADYRVKSLVSTRWERPRTRLSARSQIIGSTRLSSGVPSPGTSRENSGTHYKSLRLFPR